MASPPSLFFRRMISVTLHSIAQGLAATRGGFTSVLAAISRPACKNSFSPSGRVAEVAFISLRRSYVGMFQTNSPVSCAKVTESLMSFDEKASSGGLSATALKKE